MAQQTMYRAIGVFTDREFAQRVVDRLKQSGYNAMIATNAEAQNLPQYGFNNDEVALYTGRYKEGNPLVLVDAGDQGNEILDYLLQAGAENIDLTHSGQADGHDARYYQALNASDRRYGPVDTDLGRARTADESRLILRNEQLIPVKQAVQAGEVQLRKTVEERPQEVPVTVAREEITIERRPLTDASLLEQADLQEQTINVPVYAEQAQLQRQVTGEEVVVHKQRVEEQQTLTGTTRHEHLEVDQTGNVAVQGNAADTTRTATSTNNQNTTNSR